LGSWRTVFARSIRGQSFFLHRMGDELLEPLQTSLLLLGADDPPARCFSVGWRLALEETPCGLILFHQPIVRLFELGPSLLIGVDARSILLSGFIGLEARGLHLPFLDQGLNAFDIDSAPDASGLSRRESDLVARRVNA